jgi:hypothetical protein
MKCLAFLLLLMLITTNVSAQATPVPPLMNFQGRLSRPDGTPVADGTYSMRFSLWNAATGGTEKWNQTLSTIAVSNGVFNVLLDVATAGLFTGDLWLEIKIGTDAPLTPRQPLVSVAYAMKANSVPDGSIRAAQIADGTITANKLAPDAFNPLAWLLGGNTLTNPNTQFLGTLNNQPLVFKVNGKQAMRYSYVEKTDLPGLEYRSINVLGGTDLNSIAAGVVGATIAGGGQDYFTGVDQLNQVNADFGTVGGGNGNNVAGLSSTIAGGVGNYAEGKFAAIGGGVSQLVRADYATIPGGFLNYAFGKYSFAAGQQAQAGHDGSFVWNDASNTTIQSHFASTGVNQFLIQATGGVGINKNNPAPGTLDVNGNVVMTGFQLTTGAAANRVLTSNAAGIGTWQTVMSLLGNAGGDLSGTYPNPTIANNAVTTAKVADANITTPKLADNAVTSAKIAEGAVSNSKLASDAASLSRVSGGAMTALPSGKIGLGTTLPEGLLDVYGPNSLGAPTLDQQQTADGVGTPRFDEWQSFTAGQSGLLTRVDLLLGGSGTDTTSLALYEGEGTGGPLLMRQDYVYQVPAFAFKTFMVSNTPYLTAGRQYTLRFFAASAHASTWFGNNTNPYAGGRSEIDPAIDYAFKTYISASTNASLLTVIPGGNVGIGTATPTTRLDVNGTARMTGFRLSTGGAAGKILTSDASGIGTWQTLSLSGIAAGGDLTGTYPNPAIANNAVTTAKVADANITTPKLAANAITSAKIADGTITAADLAAGILPTSLPPNGAAGGDLTGTYPNPTIAANAVASAKLASDPTSLAKVSGNVMTSNAGRIGIGTGSPGAKLHVSGGNIQLDANSELFFGDNGQIRSLDNNHRILFRRSENKMELREIGDIVFSPGALGGQETPRVIMMSNGNVGIGVLTTSYKLRINGNVGATDYDTLSDRRYKTNIHNFDNALDTILNLRGVTFEWKKDEFKNMNFTEGRRIGFIAQEVEKILPELVTTDENGYKAVAYANVVPVLVEAVKTLKQDNDVKEKRLSTVEAENAELKKQLSELTSLVRQIQAAQEASSRERAARK